MDYIAGHRGEFGAGPIRRMLTEHGCPIAPSTFYQAVSRRRSRRQLRDEQLIVAIAAERAGSRHLAGLGARKMWLRLRSQGHDVARCTAGRLMAQMGVTGLTRGARPQRTTRPRPGPLTWAGMACVAFVSGVFARRILGWRAATAMTTPLVLDCLEQAIWTRRCEGTRDLADLVHHTDAGSQGGFNRSSQHCLSDRSQGTRRELRRVSSS